MKKNTEYIGVEDKYIPEEEKYVDESVLGDKEKASKTLKKFGIGYICFFLLFFVLIIGFIIFQFTNVMKAHKNFGNLSSSFNKTTANAQFEQYQGTTTFTRSALDKIVTNNKKYPDHKITVVYNGKTAVEEDDIVEIKNSLTATEYEVSLNYDSNGYINKFIINDIVKKQSAKSFNLSIKGIEGHQTGIDYRLDMVISSNKTNSDHIIAVVYKETTATTEDEILELEKQLDEWTKYYYSLDYDEEGYINKITIKDM